MGALSPCGGAAVLEILRDGAAQGRGDRAVTVTLSGPMLPPKSGAAARQLMVLLHGYGADGSDLISLGVQWRELWPDMLFVSPNAPEACDMNAAGYQWFPLR